MSKNVTLQISGSSLMLHGDYLVINSIIEKLVNKKIVIARSYPHEWNMTLPMLRAVENPHIEVFFDKEIVNVSDNETEEPKDDSE